VATSTEVATPPAVATATVEATATASLTAASPTLTATADPTAAPTPTPTEAAATASPSGTATATPTLAATAWPSPVVTPISEARALADGDGVTLQGVLTTTLGALDGGRGGFIADASGGIALYLPAIPANLPAGTLVRATGTVDDRYGQRTLRVSDGGLAELGSADLPAPVSLATGEADEAHEGILVAVSGTISAAPDALSDGTGLWLDDGSGTVRVVVTPAAAGDLVLTKGARVAAAGPLGQHASGSSAGYRVVVTEPGAIVILAAPPEASPSGPGTSASAGPSAADSGLPLESIADARAMAVGTTVHVAGVVTMAPGTTGSALLFTIGDPTGGVFVRLDGALDGLAIGRSVEVAGTLASPYGQLEIRYPVGMKLGSLDGDPAPVRVRLGALDESTEGSLVMAIGTVDSVRVESGRLILEVGDGSVEVRVMADPASGLGRSDVTRGDFVIVTGIVGQYASASGAADGYRLWLRNRSDLVVLSIGGGSTGGAAAPTAIPQATSAGSSPAPTRVQIASLGDRIGQRVTISGVVTVADGGRAVLDDGTGQVRIGGEAAASRIAGLVPGDAVEAGGLVTLDSDGLLLEVDEMTMVTLPGAGSTAGEAGSAAASALRPGSRASAPAGLLAADSGGLDSPVPWLPLAVGAAVALAAAGAASAARRIRARTSGSRDRRR
jgi:hypothetical protein